MLRALVQRLKWPIQTSVFVAHLVHHTLAFFVWAVLLLHVVMPMLSAGVSARLISAESRRFLTEGSVSWRGVLAAALVPAVLVALRQAYLSWEEYRDWLRTRGFAPTHPVHLLKWPVRTGRFVATVLHQTAGFFGWAWIVFALIGSIGQAGFHMSKLWEYGVAYLAGVGGSDWERLLALAVVPALLIAIWNAKRAYRRLHSMVHERVQKHEMPGSTLRDAWRMISFGNRSPASAAGKTSSPLDCIEHFVVLMLENRSFDTMLGRLYPKSAAFEGLAGTETNVDGDGASFGIDGADVPGLDPFTIPSADPGEHWADINEQIFGWEAAQAKSFTKPNMSGFVSNYLRQKREPLHAFLPWAVMYSFSPAQLPVLSGLARQFAVCDRWFASAPCQTWPNRFFMHTGTHGGFENNCPGALYDMPTIFERLQEAKGFAGWSVYYHDIAQSMALSRLWANPVGFAPFDKFLREAANGTLPAYSFIEPRFFTDLDVPNDQHPPHDVTHGEKLIADVYNALRNGPAWNSTLLIITYDEHGGCYDHVPPPIASAPSSEALQPFAFDRYGVRVPAVLVSPYIRPGTILRPPGRVPFDHTSVIATLRKRFGLGGPLTLRDAVAPTVEGVLTLSKPDNAGPSRVAARAIGTTLDLRLGRSPKQLNALQQSLLELSRNLPTSLADVDAHVLRKRTSPTAHPHDANISPRQAIEEVKRCVSGLFPAIERLSLR
jgi:phospholipase C